MGAWALRVREDADGFYVDSRGRVIGLPLPSREEAELIRRDMPNGREFEAVEVAR